MKMNVMTALTVTAFAAIALGLSACSEAGVSPTDVSEMRASVATTFDLNGAPADFYDATEMQPVEGRPDAGKDKPVRNPFVEILGRLNLSAEQRSAVASLLERHNDCVKSALEALRAAEREIIAAARAASSEVIEQVKAGTLTRQEGREQLRAINARTREALRSLPLRDRVRAAVKECDAAFLNGLRRILNADQLAILERWIASKRGAGDPPPPPGGRDGDGSGDKPGGRGDSTGTGGRGRG